LSTADSAAADSAATDYAATKTDYAATKTDSATQSGVTISASRFKTMYTIFTNSMLSDKKQFWIFAIAIYYNLATIVIGLFSHTAKQQLSSSSESGKFLSYFMLFASSVIVEVMNSYFSQKITHSVTRIFTSAAYNEYDTITRERNSTVDPKEFCLLTEKAATSLCAIFKIISTDMIFLVYHMYNLANQIDTSIGTRAFLSVFFSIVFVGVVVIAHHCYMYVTYSDTQAVYISKKEDIKHVNLSIASAVPQTSRLQSILSYLDISHSHESDMLQLQFGFIFRYKILYAALLILIQWSVAAVSAASVSAASVSTASDKIGPFVYSLDDIMLRMFSLMYQIIGIFMSSQPWNSFYESLLVLRNDAVPKIDMPKSMKLSDVQIANNTPTSVTLSPSNKTIQLSNVVNNQDGSTAISSTVIGFLREVSEQFCGPKRTNSIGNIKFRRGDKVLISGESGSGKSSFLHAMCGKSQYMRIRMTDTAADAAADTAADATRFDSLLGDIDPLQFAHCCVVYGQTFRETLQLESLTLREVFDSASVNKEPVSDTTILKYCKKTRIDSLITTHGMDSQLSNLSGGETTRVCLALILWLLEQNDNRCLLLDEPEQGLNYELAVPIIREILTDPEYSNTTIFVVSHVPQLDKLVPFDCKMRFQKSKQEIQNRR
jgi:ABC-type lipoprotein export system ATPase subunit